MLYLACYDIEDSKIRLKVANDLLAAGLERLQESVFVGSMDKGVQQQLVQTLTKRLTTANPATSHLLLIPLAESYARNSFWLGDKPPDWPYHLNQVATLIF